MQSRILRGLLALDLGEQILNAGAAVSVLSVAFPWIGGDWLGGDTVSYTGFGFYTAFIGIAVFLLNAAILLITLIPLSGGPVLIRKRYRDTVRLSLSAASCLLVLAALSVLMRVTLEFTRMDVRFGIYMCLIGSIVAVFESFIRFVEQWKTLTEEPKHDPDETPLRRHPPEPTRDPPPPPPAPAAEDHRIHPSTHHAPHHTTYHG